MKIAFFALVTTTRILLAAGNNAKLIWTGTGAGTDYVTGTTANEIQFTVTLPANLGTTAGTRTETLTFTQSPATTPLFAQTGVNGKMAIDTATLGGANVKAKFLNGECDSGVTTAGNVIECKTATDGVIPAGELVLKLKELGTPEGKFLQLAAGTVYSFTATYPGGTVQLAGFASQPAKVKSGSITLPPSSHVESTTPTSFDFTIQPRTPLTTNDKITVTCDRALFKDIAGTGALEVSSVSQEGNTFLIKTMIGCVATTQVVTCTYTNANVAQTISTSAPLKVSLLPTTGTNSAQLAPLLGAGTEYRFTYRTDKDITALSNQLAFVTQKKQMKSATVALTPNTYFAGSTPTSIQFNLELRQPLSGTNNKITIKATHSSGGALCSSNGALKILSVSQGVTSNFAATVTATALEITINSGGSISNSAPFIISLASNVAKFAPLGAAGEIVTFTFTTSLADVDKTVNGWTVAAAPVETAGKSQLAAAVAAGANCVQAFASTGFYKGTWIQFGDGTTPPTEQKTIRALYTSTDCTGSEISTSRRLAPSSVVGVGLDSPLQYGYDADTAITAVEGGWGPTCFPGDAMVNVYNRGPTEIASISVGDKVLVESVGGGRTFAPVLAFLHKVPGSIGLSHESVTVVHSQGTFRASANHLAFVLSEGGVRADMPVSALRPGDHLIVQSANGKEMPSLIISTGLESTTAGMYAPCTSSGSLVVDGVIASNYGAPSSGTSLPHGAAHAAFFALRLSSYLHIGSAPKLDAFAKMMLQQLRLNKHA